MVEDVHSTLKIFLNSEIPISEISDSAQVSILSPQSKISHMWFLEGSATLTKSTETSDEIPDDVPDDIPDDETEPEKFSVTLTESMAAGDKG